MKNNNLHILFGLILVAFVGSVALLMILPTVISHHSGNNTKPAPAQAPAHNDKEQAQPRRPLSQPEQVLPQTAQTAARPAEPNNPSYRSTGRYLHSVNDICGRDGQPASTRKEIPCPDRIKSYKNWPKTCQEITFTDGSKSIIYLVKERGLVGREDFSAEGRPVTLGEFATAGGYYNTDTQTHIPRYPDVETLGITYAPNATLADTRKVDFVPAQLNEDRPVKAEKGTRAPRYCDLYPKECKTDPVVQVSLLRPASSSASFSASSSSGTISQSNKPISAPQTKRPATPQKQEPFIPPYDEELAAKIQKVFEPVLPADQSKKLGRSYAVQGYHIRIMPGVYDELTMAHRSAEEKAQHKKILAAHKQAVDILRQERALKEKQTSVPAYSGSAKKEEFYLPGLSYVKGPNGQAVIRRTEIPCPDRTSYPATWPSVCQEIQFEDGTKSIVYITQYRGIVARDDFDAHGHLLVNRRFYSTGGYFDPDKLRHIPDYPSTISETFFYDENGVASKTEIYSFDEKMAEKTKQSLQKEFEEKQQMPQITIRPQQNAQTYCDVYKSECVKL